MLPLVLRLTGVFLSTPSARRATPSSVTHPTASKFLSTPSARRATRTTGKYVMFRKYFYPRPPRGGRRIIITQHFLDEIISIHALREEGDCTRGRNRSHHCISIHALREEGDDGGWTMSFPQEKFLSTPSARRATSASCRSPSQKEFLSTPSARRATGAAAEKTLAGTISIHALREEGDDR